jgi:peptidoglycan/LPS O-acetylase OafA/YrhL
MNPSAHGNLVSYAVHWLYMIGAASLLCYASAPDHPHVRWLCTPWLRWCGIISYEWYLFHQPIIAWIRELIGPAGGSFFKFGLVVAISLPASMILSALVYRIYSLPILKFGRSKRTAAKR